MASISGEQNVNSAGNVSCVVGVDLSSVTRSGNNITITCNAYIYHPGSYSYNNWCIWLNGSKYTVFDSGSGAKHTTKNQKYYTGSKSFTVACSGTSYTLSVGVAGNNWNPTAAKQTANFSITGIPPAYTKYTVNSWSAALSQNIINLKSTIKCNVTKGTNDFSFLENEISNTNSNIVKQVTFHSGGNYNNTSVLTCTATEIINSTGLGVALYSNLEISDGTNSDELYSAAYTPPANINSSPTISGSPAVTKVTASNIQVSVPAVSNWVRSEGTAFYCHALTCCDSAGNTTGIHHAKWGQSHQAIGTLTMPIASAQSGSIVHNPETETVSAGSASNYTLNRGSTYYYKAEAITKFLGLRKNGYSSMSGAVYIPYLPSISAAFSYGWVNADGALYYRMTQANVTPNNPNNEYLGNGYLSLNTTKVARASVSGNIWTANSTNGNLRVKYTNAAISGTARAWQYYATNKYSESIIDPVSATASFSVAANRVNCSIGTPTIVQGILKTTNVTFNVPDTSLPVGTMTAVLQVSKSSNFSSITYQQEKTVSGWGNQGQLFDPITLGKGDVGTNYVRVLWKLANSSNYYAFANVYSNTASAEFTGILPVIDSFIATTEADGKINVTVVETTGAPSPTLTVEVLRESGGSVYQSYNVTSGNPVTLPYNEPGTIWYIRAKANNVMGTVYALEEDGTTVAERTIEIPYDVTEGYEEIANPVLVAGDVQLDGKCNFTMNWTGIETTLDKVQYNVEMITDNNPIDPIRFEDVSPGMNHTFTGRRDMEKIKFQLECIVFNSLGDAVQTYLIDSNEVELDSIDTADVSFDYHIDRTYHSLTYVFDSMNKNSNKLVSMSIELIDPETGDTVGTYFIGEVNITSQTPDIDPIQTYTFDSLLANKEYEMNVSYRAVNPLDVTKEQSGTKTKSATTRNIVLNPVKNLTHEISNIIDGVPTTASDIDLTWETPDEGDAQPQSYIVAFKKTGDTDYTNIYLTDLHYVLAHTVTNLSNNDVLNVRVGAQYYDYFGTEIIKWTTIPSIAVSGTNYKYYVARYPETEIADKHIYKIVENGQEEELVRDLYLDK